MFISLLPAYCLSHANRQIPNKIFLGCILDRACSSFRQIQRQKVWQLALHAGKQILARFSSGKKQLPPTGSSSTLLKWQPSWVQFAITCTGDGKISNNWNRILVTRSYMGWPFFLLLCALHTFLVPDSISVQISGPVFCTSSFCGTTLSKKPVRAHEQ
jgi:hypothetical protein